MPFPLFSAIVFMLAGVIAIPMGATSEYKDLIIWGSVSLALAVMAFFGWRGKRRDKREQVAERQRTMERDERLEALLTQQRSTPAVSQSPSIPPWKQLQCPQCGKRWPDGTRFCGDCGSTLPVAAPAQP